MHPSLNFQEHRPWPLPKGRWTWRQSWCDLLFAHWPISASQLRPLIPPELTLQEFDGSAWIGIVPFRMEGVMLRHLPNLPWISAFPELNVRTYVEKDGKAGVWFLSLDATNPLAVWAAQRFYHLPYFWSRMSVETEGEGINYVSRRRQGEVNFLGRYEPTSSEFSAKAGTLEHWLTERYCLFAKDSSGRIFRTEVHHKLWPLQKARLSIKENGMLTPHGLSVSGDPVQLHFARRIDVVIWPPEECKAYG